MSLVEEFLAQHLFSVVIGVLCLVFAGSILRQHRPTGSAFAWLLVIFLIPYLGIPLYLIFGGRKFRRQAHTKAALHIAETSRREISSGPVEWLDDGVEAYRAYLEGIRGATKSIRILTFLIGNDETGRSLLNELTLKARAGVRVHLLIDDFFRIRAPRRELWHLIAAGGRVARFMPLFHLPFRGQPNLRNHRKIAIFDGDKALTGGMNLAEEYMGPKPKADRWRDLTLAVSGECVAALDAIFRADWQFAARETLEHVRPSAAEGVGLKLVTTGPDSMNDGIYESLLTALFRADRRFWVATPYFIPDETLNKALAIAAHRGVDVRVVVPRRSNHLIADIVAAPFLRQLEEAGVKVHRYAPGMMHAKAVLVDDHLAMVGSANFDMRSLFLGYELALFFPGAEEVGRLEHWFQETIARTRLGAPHSGRLRSRFEDVARLLAPLL